MLIDTHCHINFHAFKDDADAAVKRALAKNIWMIAVGSQFSTSQRAVEYANKYPAGVFAAIGLHPIHLEKLEIDEAEEKFVSRAEEFDAAAYRQLSREPRVVAIGEVGLDFYHIDPRETEKIEKQKLVFRQQIELAIELDLPIIIHCRASKENPADAYEEIMKILEEYRGKARGVFHFFGGTKEYAEKLIEMGFYVGFTGVVTFKNAGRSHEVVSALPLERILVETDCPYVAPEPYRGKRNEPAYVEFVAQKIAEVKNLPLENIAKTTTKNAMELFGLAKWI